MRIAVMKALRFISERCCKDVLSASSIASDVCTGGGGGGGSGGAGVGLFDDMTDFSPETSSASSSTSEHLEM
jgi:hypothetical protein